MTPEPDTRRYAEELRTVLRERDPGKYRQFLRRWRDLHERGVADRLAQQDDIALRLRMERMILSMPQLADLHEAANAYIMVHTGPAPKSASPSNASGTGAGNNPAMPRPPSAPGRRGVAR